MSLLITQLHTPIPVNVVAGCGWQGPTGKAMAFAWFQMSIEGNMVFVVAMDETGEIWQVEGPNIRMRSNITWGRPLGLTYEKIRKAVDPASSLG